jgi:hypothetical protein
VDYYKNSQNSEDINLVQLYFWRWIKNNNKKRVRIKVKAISKRLLRGDFLQSRVFDAKNQSDCRNAEKAIEQCWQYGGVVSYRGVCRLKRMQFLTRFLISQFNLQECWKMDLTRWILYNKQRITSDAMFSYIYSGIYFDWSTVIDW